MTVFKWILVLVVSYLLGCFQTGVAISRYNNVDIRSKGSKSTGTTNVFRVMGAKASLLTFVGDILKGVLSCLLGLWLLGNAGASMAGIAVVVGHMFPVFSKFRGGKGVATSLGSSCWRFPRWASRSRAWCRSFRSSPSWPLRRSTPSSAGATGLRSPIPSPLRSLWSLHTGPTSSVW